MPSVLLENNKLWFDAVKETLIWPGFDLQAPLGNLLSCVNRLINIDLGTWDFSAGN